MSPLLPRPPSFRLSRPLRTARSCVCAVFRSCLPLLATPLAIRSGAGLQINAAVEGKGSPLFAKKWFAVRFHGEIHNTQIAGRSICKNGGFIEFANAGEAFELRTALCGAAS